jgi:hypothetical protein
MANMAAGTTAAVIKHVGGKNHFVLHHDLLRTAHRRSAGRHAVRMYDVFAPMPLPGSRWVPSAISHQLLRTLCLASSYYVSDDCRLMAAD